MSSLNSSESPSKQFSSSTSKQPKRIFTDEDEISLLSSLLNSTDNSILDGRFSEAQITTKIRRLKQRYQKQTRSESSIRKTHDLKTYEISCEIWGHRTTRASPPTPLMSEKEEDSKAKSQNKIKWNDFPFLMKQVSTAPATNNEVYKQGLTGLGEDILKGLDKKWMELEMEEAVIQARIAELAYNQLKSSVDAAKRN